MRPGEVFNLKPEDIHEGYVFVRQGKTKYARRTIPLTDRAKTCWIPRISQQIAIRRHKALNVDFRIYDARHTYITRLVMAGVDLMTVKELAGHASITMTQKYAHPTPAHRLAAVEKLEAYNALPPNNPHSKTSDLRSVCKLLAEREGFEPSVPVLASTTV